MEDVFAVQDEVAGYAEQPHVLRKPPDSLQWAGAVIQMASIFGERERSTLRDWVIAGLARMRQAGTGLAQDRGRHQEPSAGREWHSKGRQDGRLPR
jgi:hypothetical protein